jgi:hypothetical protein
MEIISIIFHFIFSATDHDGVYGVFSMGMEIARFESAMCVCPWRSVHLGAPPRRIDGFFFFFAFSTALRGHHGCSACIDVAMCV